MSKLKYILLLSCLFLVFQSKSQELLSKSEAIQIVLENNFDVIIAKSNLTIAENNTGILNSGYLPSVIGNAAINYNLDDISVEFQDGSERALNSAKSDNRSAGLNLNYVLFDGFNRQYNIKRNQENLNKSQLNVKATLENTLLSVFSSYYEVARLEQNLQSLKASLSISKERLTRAGYGFDYGQNTKLDVSNAEVDVNSDSINYLNARQSFENAKRNLNFILGRIGTTDFLVDTTVSFAMLADKENFKSGLLSDNVQIQLANADVSISTYNTRVSSSSYLPKLNAVGGYNYRKSNNNSASFTAANSSTGLSGGLSLGWNIFDGGASRTVTQNAKINQDIQSVLLSQVQQQVELNFENAWGDYENKLYIVKARLNNLKTNRLNFQRTEEQYRLGQATSIEFRTSQNNLLIAETNLIQARFEAKLAELTIYQLSGKLQEAEF